MVVYSIYTYMYYTVKFTFVSYRIAGNFRICLLYAKVKRKFERSNFLRHQKQCVNLDLHNTCK